MKYEVILSGVGGQGVLSVGSIISQAAVDEGLAVRQSEVHGMAQRGGAVLAHLRMSDGVIAGVMVPKGGADIILSMEPLESLRQAAWLSPNGTLITATEPVCNIDNYPPMEEVIAALNKFPRIRLIETAALAKEAGFAQAINMVMVGAASPFLPLKTQTLESAIAKEFALKGEDVVAANIKAFQLGRQAAAKN